MQNQNTKFKLDTKEPNIISLIVLSAFASMGAILITPALPTLGQYFHIGQGTAQLTVTSFLLGYAFGQLVYGPIANRLGRKPAFYIGICIATIGSIFSIISSPLETYDLMILGRFLEALGSSVGLVVCFTIINDFYFPQQARRITGMMMLAFAVVPGVAITVGGLLTQHIDWQSCFYFLLVYGLVLIYPAVRLPETIIARDPHALRSHYLVKNYFAMLKNKKLLRFAIFFGFSNAVIYVFSAEGPFIGIHLLDYKPANYGMLALLPYAGAVIGSILSTKLSQYYSTKTLLFAAFFAELTGALILFVCFLLHFVNIYTLLTPMALVLMGHILIISSASILAMEDTEDKANGSAMMSFIAMFVPVIMTFVLGVVPKVGAIILPIIFIICLLFMLASYKLFKTK